MTLLHCLKVFWHRKIIQGQRSITESGLTGLNFIFLLVLEAIVEKQKVGAPEMFVITLFCALLWQLR